MSDTEHDARQSLLNGIEHSISDQRMNSSPLPLNSPASPFSVPDSEGLQISPEPNQTSLSRYQDSDGLQSLSNNHSGGNPHRDSEGLQAVFEDTRGLSSGTPALPDGVNYHEKNTKTVGLPPPYQPAILDVPNSTSPSSSKRRLFVLGGVIAAVVIALAVGLGVGLGTRHTSQQANAQPDTMSNSASADNMSVGRDRSTSGTWNGTGLVALPGTGSLLDG